MFVVLFEVEPRAGRRDDYLGLAGALKPKLEAIDGFLDNERFASKRTEGRVLSLSTWRDEKALVRWRTGADHHRAQERGRFEIFAHYRIRVGEVTVDSAPPAGIPVHEHRFDETERAEAKAATITELTPRDGAAAPAFRRSLRTTPGLLDQEVFESIANPGKALLLLSWRDLTAAGNWSPHATADGSLRHRRVRVIRDYGMHERAEAPQFYPEVARPGTGNAG